MIMFIAVILQILTFAIQILSTELSSEQRAVVSLLKLSGVPGQGYYANVYIGTPPQEVKLLVDTGSANLAVAAKELQGVSAWFHTNLSSTLVPQNMHIVLSYQQGKWSGQVANDYLDLQAPATLAANPLKPPRLKIQVALIQEAVDFFLGTKAQPNWNGIVGFAYSNIAVQPVGLVGISYAWLRYLLALKQPGPPPIGHDPYLTPSTHSLMEDMVQQYDMPDQFSALLCGSTRDVLAKTNAKSVAMTGLLMLGGSNNSNSAPGALFHYTPVRYAWYFEVILTDFRVNGKQVIDDCKELNFDKTIVDTGTTNIRLPQRVFDRFLAIVQDHVKRISPARAKVMSERFWQSKSVLCQTAVLPMGGRAGSPFNLFPELDFDFVSYGTKTNTTVLNVQLSPQVGHPYFSANSKITPSQQYIRYVGQIKTKATKKDCFVFGVQRATIGTVLGAVFVEGFHTHFDREKMKIGFADSPCSTYTTIASVPKSRVIGAKVWSEARRPEWRVLYPLVWRTKFPGDCAFYRPDFDPFRRELWGLNLWQMTFIILCTLLFILAGLFFSLALYLCLKCMCPRLKPSRD